MNFLRHPLYTALALGACTWLFIANMQGKSFFYSSGISRGAYYSSHFSHK